MRPTPRRNAMTIVELLVVIAIIGVLVAMLLPAVQMAREAARKVTCTNNMRQIGLAVHHFEEANGKLPPGGIWKPDEVRGGSVYVHLLPMMEQQALYEAFDFRSHDLDDSVFPGSDRRVDATVIETLICPSDERETHYGAKFAHNYAASRGPTEVWWNTDCLCDYPWANLALAPVDDPQAFAGPFTRVGTQENLQAITDGLSNTIFFGEVRPQCSQHSRNGWVASNNGNGYCTTLIPINYDTCNDASPDPCRKSCNWNTEVGFKSAHPGGAHFLYGDGSVHFIADSIDHALYQRLGAKNDGEAIGTL